jgi:CO/xanthine dehydrogenase Mo-binding subunit
MVKSAFEPTSAVGTSMPRLEAWEKACGAAIYTADMTLPNMLFGAVATSPYPHARIRGYDVSAALAVPGVKAVIVGADLEPRRMGLLVKDETALAIGKVRYIGEPVAAVAAIDPEIARRAARLIDVDYEELPAVFSIAEALASDAPVLHEDFDGYFKVYDASTRGHPNELSRAELIHGDTAAGFAACDVVVEHTYEMAAQYHAYLEPCASLAAVDSLGKATVWSSTQSVFRMQANLHDGLGVPMSKIRALCPRVGGGFGGKSEPTMEVIALALAQRAGRPVRIILTREEDMASMRCRHPAVIRMKTGAKRDGTLMAREVEAWFDGGAYADDSPAVMHASIFFSGGVYRFENVRFIGHALYTNKLRAGAFRGFGNPQATFASESQIDEVAQALGLDPIELRLKNILQAGDRRLGGQTIASSGLEQCIRKVSEASGWRKRRATLGPSSAGKRRGLGIALTTHVSGFLSTGAVVRLLEDGCVALNTGAVDIGQGSDTAMAQMCAAALRLPINAVNLVTPDTDGSPYNSGTNSSRVTYMLGRAIGQATDVVLKRMKELAASMLECGENDLELREGGNIGVQGTDRSVSFHEIAVKALWMPDGGGPIIGTGSVTHNEPLDAKHTLMRGMISFAGVGAYTFGAQVVEVEVDEATGKVELVEAWCAHDVGKAINPSAVEGQIQGGFAQGVGYALTEEMIWEGGRLTNPSFMDYKIPGSEDVPDAVHAIIVEVPDPVHPFGAKGIGEPPIIGAAPAIANAVAHATNTRVRQIPITPERLIQALAEMNNDAVA